jgi:hypothetical protein
MFRKLKKFIFKFTGWITLVIELTLWKISLPSACKFKQHLKSVYKLAICKFPIAKIYGVNGDSGIFTFFLYLCNYISAINNLFYVVVVFLFLFWRLICTSDTKSTIPKFPSNFPLHRHVSFTEKLIVSDDQQKIKPEFILLEKYFSTSTK